MSVYPFELDSDSDIIRIDDNITELGGLAINQIRDSIFAMQAELGTGLSGSMGTLANRLNVSLNANGTLKYSAIAAVGLVTLPIVDNQVASNAAIKESKLTLDHTTSDLYTIITANKSLLDSVNSFLVTTSTDFLNHLQGSLLLSDGLTSARHVGSHIDLNAVPSDPRDPFFTWTGLKDKSGTLRTATSVAAALLQINDDLTAHENAVVNGHVASAIDVDTDGFHEIPVTATTAQKVFDYLDRAEELNIGEHRATQHANGIPQVARSQSISNPDGYGISTVVPATPVNTYLYNPPSTFPVDSNTVGDDIVKFVPTNSNSTFDAAFSQVRVGDIIRINYGNGVEASFSIDSIRFTPGSDWTVRLNGVNLVEAADGYIDGYTVGTAYAQIDRPQLDFNTGGVLALASANSIPNNLYPTILGSVIAGPPRAATAIGIGFDGNQLNSSHYKLWLEIYPDGNPSNKTLQLPFIDVTGDAGASPGSYTLEKIIHATNDAFRKVGYNYRFIAFDHQGNFGIMLADAINNASFAIIKGSNSSGTVQTSTFTENVVGDADDGDGFDGLGFGAASADIASPAYQSTWVDATAAQHPTKVIVPVKRRFYIANGQKRDDFAPTYMATDGYWPATIFAHVSTGASVEVTYQINLDLRAAKLKPGKTITVQPTIDFTDAGYVDNDYGRFIIKEISFVKACGSTGDITKITVINGVYATGAAISFTSSPGLAVNLYFDETSVGFDDLNVIDGGPTGVNYHRYHEIYVTKDGQTFSHERARMKADQIEASPPTSHLASTYWHIKTVSQKLRGYRDNNTTFNKYVRFYVLSYDSTSGEFDGYIGKRVSSNNNIIQVGPVTTGRKNVTTRFYDETYVDYIDLEFKNIVSGPTGTLILSDTNPRYVDIEIFPTLRTDEELMPVGSCEINWDPPSNQNIVQCVQNLRQFGSIGASDFNQEAVDFIRAGERYLHQNGVVRGFEYVPAGTSIIDGALTFTGGIAVVNGSIVTTNNSTVVIPQISAAGVVPATVVWAVCVNQEGFLEPIILTSSKTQFFAQASQYYVPSVTFSELVSNRKDLTIIATVSASIASITISDSNVKDLRKFVMNEGLNNTLVLSSNDFEGNFASWDVVKNWINQSDSQNNIVRVRGNWNIDSTINLTGFNKAVTFEGDGAIITVTAAQGFSIGDNVTLRGLHFVYAPPLSLVYTSGDIINTGNGCIHAASGSNYQYISIEDCFFDQDSGSYAQRPPFINFELTNNKSLTGVRITGNTFTDVSSTTSMAAIAIVGLNSGGSSTAAFLRDVFIERNTTNLLQGIHVVTATSARPGLRTYNCAISENSCGAIGYFVASTSAGTLQNSLLITNNRCKLIASLNSLGQVMYNAGTSIDVATGNVLIQGNMCHWIHVMAQGNATNIELAALKIANNTLNAFDSSFLTTYNDTSAAAIVSGLPGEAATAAISIITKYAATETTSFDISNNSVQAGKFSSTLYAYNIGIYLTASGIVTHNIIGGINVNGYGIWIDKGLGPGTGIRRHTVTGNQIFRSGIVITAYIQITAVSTTNDVGIIVENSFDSLTVDNASNTSVVLPTPLDAAFPIRYAVERNINQTMVSNVDLNEGTWEIGGIIAGNLPTSDSYVLISASNLEYNYDNGGSTESARWVIPLEAKLPDNVFVTKFALNAMMNVIPTPGSPHTIALTITGRSDSASLAATTMTTGFVTYTVTATTEGLVARGGTPPTLAVQTILNQASPVVVLLTSIAVTYHW